MSVNYDDVLGQLHSHGLLVPSIETGKKVRCKVDGEDSEKRGWYILHEITTANSQVILVGCYGIWRGDDPGTTKITFTKGTELTQDEKAVIRQRYLADKHRAKLEAEAAAEQAALKADAAWRQLDPDGWCQYLTTKCVQNFGARFDPEGRMAIPLLDISGRIWGLQYIYDSIKQKDWIDKHGRNKQFWPSGLSKKGHFHLIGGSPQHLILIAEGYATAATLHMATHYPVAIAFDAGNLEAVSKALKKRYPKAKQLFCADDDALYTCKNCHTPNLISSGPNCTACNEPHNRKNTGRLAAEHAALIIDGRIVVPDFGEIDRLARISNRKLTDFNDLQLETGLHTVQFQIETVLKANNWDIAKAGAVIQRGAGDEGTLTPIDSTDELLQRFSLVYGKGGTVFDDWEHILIAVSDMRDACMSRETHRRWQESPDRKIVRAENVGFDPAGTDKKITCNLWSGWPTEPKAGNHDAMLGLLHSMCAGEANGTETAAWIIKWLAYPIQHPGAKMRSTIVVHGPQGTGKNLFFEGIMKIYGRYGRIIDQSAIEDKFNDWASSKLFMIADEVVARSDLYHVKNKLKGFISGEWIRINPKNIAAYEEKNHVNIVFLSNELMPVVLEEDDRRHCVIWTPPPITKAADPDFYKRIAYEMDNGGIEAMHDYLLNYPLGDFHEHTQPPHTGAKDDLMEISQDSICKFHDAWKNAEIEDVDIIPAESVDVYNLYTFWCGKEGTRPAPKAKMINHFVKKGFAEKKRMRYLPSSENNKKEKTILFLKNYDPGNYDEFWHEDRKRLWLKCHIEDFHQQVEAYRFNK